MDLLNFYYLQRVLESELDLVQTNVRTALAKARQDLSIFGVHEAAVVTQNAPPDWNVLVSGPALCTDPDGERVTWPSQQTVDCSQDHLGSSTAVTLAGQTRWISVIAEFDQTLSTPVTDGNGNTVYTRIYDSFNIYVAMGSQGVGPSRPALPADGILLCDIELAFGQVQILTGDIDITRRQDLIHETGSNIATFYKGDLVTAVVDLFAYVDALAAGTGVTFTATQNWADATTIAATDVSGAINEIISNLAAYAGAGRISSAAHATVGNYCDVSDGPLQTAIEDICDAVAGHINGGAPNHPDTAITAAAIAGSPESFPGGTTRDVEQALYGHINDRTERATAETISGAWVYENGSSDSEDVQVRFQNAPRFKTSLGGTLPPILTDAELAGRACSPSKGWGHPYSDQNEVSLGGTKVLVDICVGFPSGQRRVYVLEETGNMIYVLDPTEMGVLGNSGANLAAGLPAPQVAAWLPTAMCCDGSYVYVMFIGDHATPASRTHYLQAYRLTDWSVHAGWPATGLQLPGAAPTTGVHGGSEGLTDRCCMVPGVDKLVTANSWVPVSNANSPAITVVDTTNGTVDGYGAGDASITGANIYPVGGLASDGTYAFFTTKDTSGAAGATSCEIVSALIGTPSSGSGLGDFPETISVDTCQELVFDHDALWAVVKGYNTPRIGKNVLGAAGTWEYYYNNSAGWDVWFQPHTDPTGTRFAAFDGLNLWVQIEEQNGTAGTFLSAGKVPVGSLIHDDSTSMGLTNAIETKQLITAPSEVNEVDKTKFGRCCFDGDAIVTICDALDAGSAVQGIVRRIPRAGSR